MMEKLGAPQTHKSLKEMIAEVDEDNDGKMSFREFLLVYRKAASGDLKIAGLEKLAASCNVSEVLVALYFHCGTRQILHQL